MIPIKRLIPGMCTSRCGAWDRHARGCSEYSRILASLRLAVTSGQGRGERGSSRLAPACAQIARLSPREAYSSSVVRASERPSMLMKTAVKAMPKTMNSVRHMLAPAMCWSVIADIP